MFYNFTFDKYKNNYHFKMFTSIFFELLLGLTVFYNMF